MVDRGHRYRIILKDAIDDVHGGAALHVDDPSDVIPRGAVPAREAEVLEGHCHGRIVPGVDLERPVASSVKIRHARHAHVGADLITR